MLWVIIFVESEQSITYTQRGTSTKVKVLEPQIIKSYIPTSFLLDDEMISSEPVNKANIEGVKLCIGVNVIQLIDGH